MGFGIEWRENRPEGAVFVGGRGTCRRTAAACTDGTRSRAAEEREVPQTMPMCRHVNSVFSNGGSMERQLCDIQRMMNQQTALLMELLQAVREKQN